MTVVASQLSSKTILPGFATALSGAQDSQDQSYRNRAALRDGGGDGRVPVPPHRDIGRGSFPASN
jgi:hypothetical protein